MSSPRIEQIKALVAEERALNGLDAADLLAAFATLETEVARRQADVQVGLASIRRLEAEITNLRDRMQARELFHDRKWAAERNARTDAETDLRVALGRLDELESLKS